MSSTPSATFSVTELAARSKLPADVYDFFAGGADDEQTLRESTDAWRAYRFVPRVLRDVSNVSTATSLLGQHVAAPIGIAPVGYQGLLHEEADTAIARAAAECGLAFTVSTRSSVTPEQITQAVPAGLRWFQTYILRDRAFTLDLAMAAKASGCKAIVLTADMPILARRLRDVRNRFTLPQSISSAPRNGAPGLQSGGFAQDPALSSRDIEWLVSATGLPVVVKGVVHPDDAVMCLDSGAAAIWVSAHGGRQLDGCITPAEALSPVVDAIAGRAEVYVDGGIRRGADVLRALALGARGAFVGRPVAWGLANDGYGGVAGVLNELTDELRLAMALAGVTSVDAVSADIIRGPRT